MPEPGHTPCIVEIRTRVPGYDTGVVLATALVDEHLAACTHLRGPIENRYRWERAVENAQDWELDVVTTPAGAAGCVARTLELHPYALPAILSNQVEAAREYTAWVTENTRTS